MATANSVYALDLDVPSGRQYFNCDREWREEFIYFLLVDRFDDGAERVASGTAERGQGSGTQAQLSQFCGGTLKGVTKHLDYIQGLGCSAIWLSPIFENNGAPDPASGDYHGYSIQNYMDVDPRFGTKQDLIDLVDAAHQRNMKIFLDVVLNHSGDNWQYPFDASYRYCNGQQFPLDAFRREDRPLPVELRDASLYHRRGQIQNWDAFPEYQDGDFYGLKDYNNDETADGLRLIDVLVRMHCWWIRETDVDGFRLDAVKHMGAKAVSRFCTGVSEYAHRLGKRNFFTFGELIANDDAINHYTGPNTAEDDSGSIFFGLSSVLDFPLYFALPGVLKGMTNPAALKARYDALNNGALTRGELGRYLVTFVDNHDAVGQSPKRRFGSSAPDEQIIAGIGYLLTAIGTACLYYGTEQGFSGSGDSDALIRECIFDLDDPGKTQLNPNCRIYQEIAKIAAQFRALPELRFGRIYFRQISGEGMHFGFAQGQPCTLAFSRLLAGSEVLIAYNTSTSESRNDHILVDAGIQSGRQTMKVLYSSAENTGSLIPINKGPAGSSVQLQLQPMEFTILQ
jgi:alpha-amylase